MAHAPPSHGFILSREYFSKYQEAPEQCRNITENAVGARKVMEISQWALIEDIEEIQRNQGSQRNASSWEM